jgi:hypothetical protein
MRSIAMTTAAFLCAMGAAIAQSGSNHVFDMGEIDAALKTARLTPAQKVEVIRYRQEGEQLHYASKHGAAEVAFQKAKAILRR